MEGILREIIMILQIDDNYFNPLTITELTQNDNDTIIWFGDNSILFKNWKVSDLAATINTLIEEFHE